MREAMVIPKGAAEVVGDAPHRRVEILSEHDALHATWSRFGPGREGADLHVHHHHTDLFYVLDGELTVRLGVEDEPVAVPAGTLARVPPLVVHGFRNGSAADVRYLNLHAPGMAFADFLRALQDRRRFSWDQHPPPPDGGRPRTEAAVGGDELVAERPGLRVALLADTQAIAIAEVSGEADQLPAAPHVHEQHVESLYVIDGEIVLTAAGREHRAEAGSWVQVPAGVPHVFGPTDGARFLDIHTPSCGFGSFVRALHGDDAEKVVAAARAGFDQVLL